MTVTLTPSYILTTEHASSSYGQPVLVDRGSGEAYGPGDIIQAYPSWTYWPAWKAVERMAARRKFTDEERAFVERFVSFGK